MFSGYDIAVPCGFSGTERQWLESLYDKPQSKINQIIRCEYCDSENIIDNTTGAKKCTQCGAVLKISNDEEKKIHKKMTVPNFKCSTVFSETDARNSIVAADGSPKYMMLSDGSTIFKKQFNVATGGFNFDSVMAEDIKTQNDIGVCKL